MDSETTMTTVTDSTTAAPARYRHSITRRYYVETGEERNPKPGEWFLAQSGRGGELVPVQLAAHVTWEVGAYRILSVAPVRSDFTAMPEEGYPAAEWEELMDAIGSGEEIEVPEWVHEYFLGVLPPRWMGRRGFVFAEGADFPTWHRHEAKRFFARRFFGAQGTPESGAAELAAYLGLSGGEARRFVEIATDAG